MLVLHPNKSGTFQESLNTYSEDLFREVFTQLTFLHFLSPCLLQTFVSTQMCYSSYVS